MAEQVKIITAESAAKSLQGVGLLFNRCAVIGDFKSGQADDLFSVVMNRSSETEDEYIGFGILGAGYIAKYCHVTSCISVQFFTRILQKIIATPSYDTFVTLTDVCYGLGLLAERRCLLDKVDGEIFVKLPLVLRNNNVFIATRDIANFFFAVGLLCRNNCWVGNVDLAVIQALLLKFIEKISQATVIEQCNVLFVLYELSVSNRVQGNLPANYICKIVTNLIDVHAFSSLPVNNVLFLVAELVFLNRLDDELNIPEMNMLVMQVASLHPQNQVIMQQAVPEPEPQPEPEPEPEPVPVPEPLQNLEVEIKQEAVNEVKAVAPAPVAVAPAANVEASQTKTKKRKNKQQSSKQKMGFFAEQKAVPKDKNRTCCQRLANWLGWI